jgi:multidrug resistance protein
MDRQNGQQAKDDDDVQSPFSREKANDPRRDALNEKQALPPDGTDLPAAVLEPAALEEARETNGRSDAQSEAIYTAFSTNEKWFITAMASLASFFSPLSGQIYYPVMPTLVQNYHLTTSMINLSITTYMILQGLAPSFMGTFADASGRRPAYILAFAIYTAANIGLALQNNYAALMILRCLQSAGSSGTVSFGYGVIADIATPAERGKYIGPMAAGVMVAPALGPVIGGLLAQYLGWRSVFWFLSIISGGYLVVYIIFMPETARKVVDDGRVPPKDWWRMSLIQFLLARRRQKRMTVKEREDWERTRSVLQEKGRQKLALPNPLRSFAILLEKDALIIVTYVGLQMFAFLAVLTTTANFFGQLYGLNELQIGLCFL